MPTQTDVQNLILSARLQRAALVNNNRVSISLGGQPVKLTEISQYKLTIKALQYLLPDLTSDTFYAIYNCLTKLVGQSGVPSINPNYQAPNTTIIIEGGGSSAISYDYNQSDLIDADPPNGNWYLPFFVDGEIPVQLTINGTSTAFTWDAVNNRIYGFANDDAQSINLTVVTTT
jgi:hypothetical protein